MFACWVSRYEISMPLAAHICEAMRREVGSEMRSELIGYSITGGELVVKHAGQEMVFDWSSSSPTSSPTPLAAATPISKTEIASTSFSDGQVEHHRLDHPPPAPTWNVHWAAFYSDCTHEVHPVQCGHRLTLTYNLYTTPLPSGQIAGAPYSPLSAQQLPIYKTLEAALARPDFYPEGRVLGVKLGHAYAHTSKHLQLIPSALKGGDMYLYECFRGLGMQCEPPFLSRPLESP